MNKPFRPRLPEEVADAAGLPPGAARCPGASVQEILERDINPAPPVLRDVRYDYLGDEDVGYERYYDQAWFDTEIEKLWKRTWQWVCREEHIPEPGDYYVYEVGYLSFIVVRQPDMGVKAFWNACMHRATKLRAAEGAGSANELRCRFHGWVYGLDGRLEQVPCPWDFPHVTTEKFSLAEVRVDRWGGFIFINPDDEAPPLADYLAPIPEHFARWDLADRYVELHLAKELPCNWKAAIEAFLESYHTFETHPQLLTGVGDANVQYDVYSNHVTRFVAVLGVNSPHLEQPLTEQQLVDQMLVGDRSVLGDALKVREGETARTVMSRYLRKALGDKYGSDLSGFSDSEIIDTIEYCLFPNTVLFPSLSLPMVYRFRPIENDPNRTLFELLFLRPVPDGGERPPPAEMVRVAEEESYAVVPGMDPDFAHVYDQDTDNLRSQQQGFRASKKRGATLGNYQEVQIRHLEQTVDKYLGNQQH